MLLSSVTSYVNNNIKRRPIAGYKSYFQSTQTQLSIAAKQMLEIVADTYGLPRNVTKSYVS